MIVDTNINSADYETNSIMENIFNGIFPIITRPIKITHSLTAIITYWKYTILSTSFSSGILKADISDHFLIFSYFYEEIISSRKDALSKETPISPLTDL